MLANYSNRWRRSQEPRFIGGRSVQVTPWDLLVSEVGGQSRGTGPLTCGIRCSLHIDSVRIALNYKVPYQCPLRTGELLVVGKTHTSGLRSGMRVWKRAVFILGGIGSPRALEECLCGP